MRKSNQLCPGVDRRLGQGTASRTPIADDDPPIVAIDVEWTRHPTNPKRNRVLVYGLRLEWRGNATTCFFYPEGDDLRFRLKLSVMLSKLFDRSIPEVIPRVPDSIILVGHYARGDLAACKDFAVLKRQFDSVKGVFVTSRGAAAIEVRVDPKTGVPLDDLPRMPNHREMKISDGSGDSHFVSVTFRHTSLLVPEGGMGSLEAIGELVGLPKVELPAGYDKARMDIFVRDDRQGAERYLRRDLEIPTRYYQRIKGLMAGIGLTHVPPTLGAAAIAKFRMVLREQVGVDGNPITHERLFGIEHQKGKAYSRARGAYYTRLVTTTTVARRMFEALMADSYHGGRTEVSDTGRSEPGQEIHDIDAMSAYPTALAAQRVPDYDAAFTSTDPADFTAGALGAAEVEFATPAHIRFPVFPVPTQHGLVFPRRGVSVVTAPEIATALHLGVEVRILRGVVIPWTKDEVRPFLVFVKAMIAARQRLKKKEKAADGSVTFADTLESLVVKTMTNSLYGKTAQAVHPRAVFDSRTGTDRPLSPSAVNSAAIAAGTTGLVRAGMAEMINSVPLHRIISVSTDGFMTTATIDEIDVSGPACRILSDSRQRIAGDPALLEYKKHALQVVTARTRAVFTAVLAPGSKPILAKGSIKVPRGESDPNAYLLGVYLDRSRDTRIPRQDLISFRDQWAGNTDLVSVLREPRINLEPDHKRELVEPRMVRIAGGPHAGREHLATSSVPHETAAAMVEQRTLFEGWRHSTGRCLKDMDDWRDWCDYRDSTLAARQSGRRPHRTAGGSADDLKRQFLRALVHGEWGVGVGSRSYRDVAEWLSGAGYPTSLAAVKNASRPSAGLVEFSVAATDKTIALLAVILETYPDFEFERAFVQGHVEKIRSHPRIAARTRRARYPSDAAPE